jgi:hypothetical protein
MTDLPTRIRHSLANGFSGWSLLTNAEILDKTAGLTDRQLLRIAGFGCKSLYKLRELQLLHFGPDWQPPPPEAGDLALWRRWQRDQDVRSL